MSGSASAKRRNDSPTHKVASEKSAERTAKDPKLFISGKAVPNDRELDADIESFLVPASHSSGELEKLALGILYLWGYKLGVGRDVQFDRKQGMRWLNPLVGKSNLFAKELLDQFENRNQYYLPSETSLPKTIIKSDSYKTFIKKLTDVGNNKPMSIRDIVDKGLHELAARLAEAGVPDSEHAGLIAAGAAKLWPGEQLHIARAETTNRRPREPKSQREALPLPPQGLSWPTETYSGSPESGRGGLGIIAYLDRVWGKHIDAGIDLRSLRLVDPSATTGLKNFKRSGGSVPSRFDIPTQAEKNDRALGHSPTAFLTDPRLAQIVASRVRRGMRVPKL